MVPSCRDEKTCLEVIQAMSNNLDPLEAALRDSTTTGSGSEQERAALDKAYEAQSSISKQLTMLEEQMVPKGYKAQVPEEYKDLPQLEGRATIEFLLKKEGGAPFNVNGQNYPQAKLTMIIDGYTGMYRKSTRLEYDNDIPPRHFYTHIMYNSSSYGWQLCRFGAKGFL